MLTQAQAHDLFQSISKTAAMALRTLADELEAVQDAGGLASKAGAIHSISFKCLGAARDWMNTERKAA